METTYQNINIEPYINNFTGRKGHAGFDEKKRTKISELNRDFVWPMFLQVALIVSILSGMPIPQMFICDNEILDGGQRSTTIHSFKNVSLLSISTVASSTTKMCVPIVNSTIGGFRTRSAYSS